jgi:hypothetical protein
MRRHSSQPSPLGVTSRIWSRCLQAANGQIIPEAALNAVAGQAFRRGHPHRGIRFSMSQCPIVDAVQREDRSPDALHGDRDRLRAPCGTAMPSAIGETRAAAFILQPSKLETQISLSALDPKVRKRRDQKTTSLTVNKLQRLRLLLTFPFSRYHRARAAKEGV